MNRCDHHVSPIAPRLLRAAIPPSTGSGRDGSQSRQSRPVAHVRHRASCERVTSSRSCAVSSSVIHRLAGPDDPLGEILLLRDQRVDPLLERADARELAHLHVLALTDPERAIGRLILDRRVPPAIEVDDVVGRGEVEARAARLQRQDISGGPPSAWNRATISSRARLRGPAVQEQHLAAEPLLQVTAQQVPELGELGEAQRLVPLGERLGEDLLEPRELAGAPIERGAVLEQVRRVVARLLELHQRREDDPRALDPGGVLGLLDHLVDDRLVERRLLLGQVAVDAHLDLLGQVADDAPVGLQPAQDERAGRLPQALGRVAVAVALDRRRVAAFERRRPGRAAPD